MALTGGDKLGPYEILVPIGAGGMGEVYRARDPRLNRDVAIKVSTAQFSERFEREAKTVAALNHPNVCHLYDVGPNYIVMEYIEGEAPQGPMPLEEALKIARQICAALEAAHEKGITHRDLKPANIKIKPDGTVKVLDFGLAKVAPVSDGDSENSPTLSMAATQMGMILGTAGYMSPEQARGKAVDKRADIWAFGVVLYELLMGKRLFQGEDVSHTMAAVIMQEPNLDEVPVQVRKLLRRCLEKDPKKRLRDISGVELLLESGAESPPNDKAAAISQPNKQGKLPWVVAAVLAGVAAYVSFVHLREVAPEVHAVNATLLPPENGEFDFSNPNALPAISPDGSRIVFGAKTKDGKQQLWLRRLDSPNAQPLPGTEDAGFPFWSPDSRWVAFGQASKLKKIDIQGGPPVPITDLAEAFRGGSWNDQGVIVFGINAQGPILRVSAAGGTAVPTTVNSGDSPRFSHRSAWFLPDGKHFLYTNSQDGDIPIRVGSLDEPSKPGKLVAQAHSTVQYAQGHLLYLRENTLMEQPFNVKRLETTGEATAVAEGIPTYTTPSRPAGFSVSPSGLLVYVTGAGGGQSRLVWKDRAGRVLGNLGEPTAQIGSIALSPDGTRLAAAIINQQRRGDLWIYDTARGVPTRFTFDSSASRQPVWSPDGNMLYYSNAQKGSLDLYRKASNGASNEELLLADNRNKDWSGISPDGKILLYSRAGEKTREDILVMPSTTGRKDEARPFLQTPFRESDAQFSPDGKWVVYESNESGQFQVYAAPFPGPGGKRQISPAGGGDPRWRKDGKEILYVTQDGQLMAAEVAARNGTLEIGKVQKLFEGILTNYGMTYDVSADGQKILVVENGASAVRPLTLVQNWTAALRK